MKNQTEMPSAPEPETTMEGEFHPHDVKNWADKILEAEELKNDPKKMKHILPHLNRKMSAIKNLSQLKSVAKKKISDLNEV